MVMQVFSEQILIKIRPKRQSHDTWPIQEKKNPDGGMGGDAHLDENQKIFFPAVLRVLLNEIYFNLCAV